MRVLIDDNVYDGVGRAMYRKMLRLTGRLPSVRPLGVYAIEKNGMTIMLNRKAPNRKVLNKQIEAYESKGFKVYYNG